MSAPSGAKPAPHYQARQRKDGEWYFSTPVGDVDRFENRFDCLRMAANHERADRHRAATSTELTERDQALRLHFFPDGLPKPAVFPLDLRPHHGG